MNAALLNDTMATGVVLQGSESFIEAFEEAWQSRGPVVIEEFLPASEHPEYLAVLVELIRVDLEYTWKSGKPVALTEYHRRFPEAFADGKALREMAYEEYRLRRLAGDAVSPAEYGQRFEISTEGWELIAAADTAECAAERSISTRIEHAGYLAELRKEQPEVLRQWAHAVSAVPSAGATLHGFHLLQELGKGAFGRVFLARQGDLANRFVVVKVATDLYQESQTLAQLQHGHIVPIISVHQSGGLQAVCMPYFGATTLGYVLEALRKRPAVPASGAELRGFLRKSEASRASVTGPEGWEHLESRSYVEAVLWLVLGLADGLAHAHAQGILHCDLKPENVLLADDGRSMLLDFNLAATPSYATTALRRAGGTLPYMAPEHLEILLNKSGQVDERCDVYGLGMILFEMLTGQAPFSRPTGKPCDVLAKMIAERRGTVPSPRRMNPAVTPPWKQS